MADFFKNTLATIYSGFMKIEGVDGLNIKNARMDDAFKCLKDYAKKDKKMYDREEGILYPLFEALAFHAEEDDEKEEKIRNVTSALEKLRDAKTVKGSIFLGMGTKKYYKGMVEHCKKIKEKFDKQKGQKDSGKK